MFWVKINFGGFCICVAVCCIENVSYCDMVQMVAIVLESHYLKSGDDFTFFFFQFKNVIIIFANFACACNCGLQNN